MRVRTFLGAAILVSCSSIEPQFPARSWLECKQWASLAGNFAVTWHEQNLRVTVETCGGPTARHLGCTSAAARERYEKREKDVGELGWN